MSLPLRVDRNDRQERRWLRAVSRGNRAAFERLFRSYERPLMGYFSRLLRDRSRAEELVSDTLFQVWRGAGAFAGRGKVSSWIFGIAHHKAVDALRRRAPTEEKLESHPLESDPDEQPETVAERGERATLLRRALDRLPPPQREVIELAFFQGLSYAEIGQIGGVPENTVKTRMFHAKRRLQPLLERMGVDP